MLNKKNESVSKLDSWYSEAYSSAVLQRNVFMLIAIISIIVTISAVLALRYVKNTKSIEPFVIEIERKTGIPTVVDPLTVHNYSANEVVKRALVMQYIKAREEYFSQTFQYNYGSVIKVMSSPTVYYNQYLPQSNPQNPNSSAALLGQDASKTVQWKSIIFPTDNTAQVRIQVDTYGSANKNKQDKIILIGFEFQKLDLNEADRLINPLGFVVTLYRIEDENTIRQY